MKNKYIIDKDTVIIYAKYKGEEKEILVSTDDLEIVNKIKGSICIIKPSGNQRYYAKFYENFNGIRKSQYLHRYLFNFPDEKVIDHINHNGLDNRRNNLRAVDFYINIHNNNGLRPVNTTGHTNVYIEKATGLWIARLVVKNKVVLNKRYSNKKLAINAVEESKRIHLPILYSA